MAAPKRWLKPAVFVGCLFPLAVLLWRGATGRTGPNLIEEALNQFGKLALVLLWASLFCSPLKRAAGWTWPMRIRRELGLFAFFYATLHFLTYAGVDRRLDWATLAEDLVKRKFIFVGFAAFVLLIPLAVTSTDESVKRMGYVRWQRLHRLVYVAAVLASVHFLWRVKADLSEPLVYLTVLALLLAFRAGELLKKRRRGASR